MAKALATLEMANIPTPAFEVLSILLDINPLAPGL
jgi:hypothetical protein